MYCIYIPELCQTQIMEISNVNNDSLQTDTDERLPKDRPDLSSGDCAGEDQQPQ
jgi:hypothetical protein